MAKFKENNIFYFFIGVTIGVVLVALGAVAFNKRSFFKHKVKGISSAVKKFQFPRWQRYKHNIVEDFNHSVSAQNGKTFGPGGAFTFELFRNGTFIVDGRSGYAWQKSDSYRDSAFIRSSQPLPKTYKITVIAGEVDYGLEKISGLPQDPEYPEGPQNENGGYLLAITDEIPTGHHTNIWWHQHRKMVIDVDNNVWGYGMPDPIFMVYFDNNNKLMAFDGVNDQWHSRWTNAVRYSPRKWYKIEIEKTKSHFISSIYDGKGALLKRSSIALEQVWHGEGDYPEYFVVGDPHENYYQGSMKIEKISLNY